MNPDIGTKNPERLYGLSGYLFMTGIRKVDILQRLLFLSIYAIIELWS